MTLPVTFIQASSGLNALLSSYQAEDAPVTGPPFHLSDASGKHLEIEMAPQAWDLYLQDQLCAGLLPFRHRHTIQRKAAPTLPALWALC